MVNKFKQSFANKDASLLLLITALFWFAQYAYMPYVNPVLGHMGTTAFFMGLVSGAYGLTQFILRVPLGLGANKIGKKRCVAAGCLLSATASFSMFFISHPAAYLIGRGLAGVASSTWVAFTILYSTYFPFEQSGASIIMLNVSNQTGRFFAFILAGAAVFMFGPGAAFALAGIFGVIAFTLALFAADHSTANKMVSLHDFIEVIKNPNLLLTSLYSIISQIIAFSTFQTFTSNHAVSIGMRMEQLSYVNLIVLIPAVVCGYLLSKYLLRRISTEALVAAGFLLLAVYCFATPLTVNARQLYMVSILAGMGLSFTLDIFLGQCVRDIPLDKRSAAMGFFQAAYSIGMTLGPVIMGWLTDIFSLKSGFTMMSAISLLAAVSVPAVYRKK